MNRIKPRELLIVALCMAGLVSVLPSSFAQDAKAKKETRLAVVDVGTKEKAPLAFMDLLTVAFGKQPNIALLERADVDRLLREQALSLSLSNPTQGTAAVKAGKIWAVDAFLMLESLPTAKGPPRLRIRLVDAHHGMKILDATWLLSGDGKQYPEQADTLALSATQKLAGFRKDAKGIRLVGVAAMQSREVSKSWDWLSETLAAGLGQHLGLEPSVIVMERKQTRTLTDERALTEGLPDALKASAFLVTGTFQLERGKGLNTISVTVQCRSAGKIILERKAEGSLHGPSLIVQKLAREIVAGLPGEAAASRSMLKKSRRSSTAMCRAILPSRRRGISTPEPTAAAASYSRLARSLFTAIPESKIRPASSPWQPVPRSPRPSLKNAFPISPIVT